MKKENGASKLEARLDLLVSKLSSFEAILVEVIFGLLLFISFLQISTVSASTPNKASLAVGWSRPSYAYVTSTYTSTGSNTNKTCSGNTSCRLGPFWGTPVIDYVVKDANTGYPIKDGRTSTYVGSDGAGYANISWTWSYEVQVYPAVYAGCDTYPSDCRKTPISSNNTSFYQIYGDLNPATYYRVILCLTGCTYYAPQLKSYVEKTGVPAKLIGANVTLACNAYGFVNAGFVWNKAYGRSYDVQYLDFDIDPNFPRAGQNVPITGDPNSASLTNLFPKNTYYFRVNSRIAGTNLWDTSATGSLVTPACAVPKPIPATLNPSVIKNCRFDGKVNLYFSWTPATNADYDIQSFEYKAGLAPDFVAVALPPSATGSGLVDQTPGQQITWRVRSHIRNVATTIVSSPSELSYTPDCSIQPKPATVTCSTVDFNLDNIVNSTDMLILGTNLTATKPYNSRYDLNEDKVVDSLDGNIVAAYFGKICAAYNLRASTVCSAIGSGNIVDVTFKWGPANGDPPYVTQWLDYDIADHGTGGGWPASLAKQFAPGVGTSGINHGFAQGTAYWWRVNTQLQNGIWISSKVGQFKTPGCVPAPTELKAVAVGSGTLADETPCVQGPYSVAFNWSGVGLVLDVSTDPGFPKGGFSNRDISTFNGLLFSTGSDLAPALSFIPGKTYFWRIYYGVSNNWVSGSSFSLASCTTVGSGSSASDFGKDAMMSSVKSRFSRAVVVPGACGDAAAGYSDCPQDYGTFLFGLAGAESGWSQDSIGYGGCPGSSGSNCFGLFQFNTNTWANAAKNLASITGKSYSVNNGWDQIDVVDNMITQDPTATAYVINQNWRADVDHIARDWNQCRFIGGYSTAAGGYCKAP